MKKVEKLMFIYISMSSFNLLNINVESIDRINLEK